VKDPLVEAAVRLPADFCPPLTLADILAVVRRCQRDLDTPCAAALPELVERLARQRLMDLLAEADVSVRTSDALLPTTQRNLPDARWLVLNGSVRSDGFGAL
jgi:hypothetical protein